MLLKEDIVSFVVKIKLKINDKNAILIFRCFDFPLFDINPIIVQNIFLLIPILLPVPIFLKKKEEKTRKIVHMHVLNWFLFNIGY